jgi:hypothetical protein
MEGIVSPINDVRDQFLEHSIEEQLMNQESVEEIPVTTLVPPDTLQTTNMIPETEGASFDTSPVDEGNEPTEPIQQTNVQKTRSGRTTRVPSRFKDFIVYESSLINDSSYDFTENIDPVALMMTTSQDTLYFHEILREPDKMEFVKAMKEEINNHNANRNWIPVRRSTVPAGNKVIPSVWAMRRKEDW